jgi:cysteine desulfurase
MAYFDFNATSPLSSIARDAWLRAADESWQNPSSPYRSAARVRNLLEGVRLRLADRLAIPPARIVFNSGATEGVHDIFTYAAAQTHLRLLPVLLSPFEHPCVLAAAHLHFAGNVRTCPVDPEGAIDLHALAEVLQRERWALVSLMAANNETGILQPWREVAELCQSTGTLFHCDASQWVGKLPLAGLGKAGFITASAHKFGGPKGCGFLVYPTSAAGFHGQTGGEQEQGLRAGTEDYPSLAAMAAALEEADDRARDSRETSQRLAWRSQFEEELERRLPGTIIAGRDRERLWNTVSFMPPIATNDRWVRKLDRLGFQTSTGSACSTGHEEPSHVLAALGFSPDAAKRAVRVSAGWGTRESDWMALVDALDSIWHQFKKEGGNGSGLTEVIQF